MRAAAASALGLGRRARNPTLGSATDDIDLAVARRAEPRCISFEFSSLDLKSALPRRSLSRAWFTGTEPLACVFLVVTMPEEHGLSGAHPSGTERSHPAH